MFFILLLILSLEAVTINVAIVPSNDIKQVKCMCVNINDYWCCEYIVWSRNYKGCDLALYPKAADEHTVRQALINSENAALNFHNELLRLLKKELLELLKVCDEQDVLLLKQLRCETVESLSTLNYFIVPKFEFLWSLYHYNNDDVASLKCVIIYSTSVWPDFRKPAHINPEEIFQLFVK